MLQGSFYEYPKSTKDPKKITAMVAGWAFGKGNGFARRVDGGLQITCERFDSLGWSREARGSGEVSVKTDAFDIYLNS